MRHAALAALLCCSFVHAQFAAEVNRLGGLDRLTLNGALVGRDLRVVVVKPQWAGSWGQQAAGGGLTVTETTEGGARVFRGEFAAEGKPIAFEERLQVNDREIVLRWKLTPSADLETQLVVVRADIPTVGNARQGSFLISDGDIAEEKPLPADLPSPYHLGGASKLAWFAWRLPGGLGLQMTPDGTGLTGVSFQDDRQFKMNAFEAQFPVAGTFGLKANRTYDFGLTLRPFDQAAYDAERQRIVDLSKALEVSLTSAKPLALRGLKLSSPRVPVYGKLELDLDLDATYDNPFDPADIDVMATFTGPGGKTVSVPGFFYQGYAWLGQEPGRRLRTVGPPGWKVRFAPPQAGPWTVQVTARDRSGQVTGKPARFTAVAATDPGFIRVGGVTDPDRSRSVTAPTSPHYLQFDNGQPYFAVGENICWDSGGNVNRYAQWFQSLGAAGGNYCRIWLVRWNMALEWTPGKGSGTYYGLGKYALDNAYKLDWVMEQARAHGIRCMLCLGYHGELMNVKAYFGENCWHESPYSQANGGPCAEPKDFWTNEQARRAYQQRLRYYVARYGWDTHIKSWELWNEVNAPAPWVKEMAGYLQAHDPNRHLVTTTYGNEEVWNLPEMDYVQDHSYGSDEGRPQTAAAIADLCLRYTTKYPKPFMVGEFGIDWKTSDTTHDPKGLGTSLHDGLWASVMTRSCGAAAVWYWDGYVHPLNQYREFAALRKFVDTVPWTKLALQPATFERPVLPVQPDAPWGDLVVQGAAKWARQPEGDQTVNPDGTVTGSDKFSHLLFSPSKPDLKAPLRFRVTYPQAGKLIFRVGTVSQGAVLHVRVDGQEIWTKELLAGEGQGEWKSTKWVEQYKIWQSLYGKDYEVPVAAGAHVIEIENTGKDWVEVSPYTFTGCRDPQYAQMDTYGLRTDDLALVWLHDRESNWYNDKYGRTPGPVRGLQVPLTGLRDGAYRLEWWDTRQGTVLQTTRATCAGGKLLIQAPDFTRDIAVKVMK